MEVAQQHCARDREVVRTNSSRSVNPTRGKGSLNCNIGVHQQFESGFERRDPRFIRVE